MTLSEELLAEIDQLAKADQRSRSNWIVRELGIAVEREKARKKIVVLPTATDAGSGTTGSTPKLAVAEDSGSTSLPSASGRSAKPVIYSGGNPRKDK